MANPKANQVDRNSLTNAEYQGEDYVVNQQLLQGPLTKRKCTDLLFAIIFLAFIGLYGFVINKSTKNGDIQELISPVDADRNLCGFTDGYADYPYLYYLVKGYPVTQTEKSSPQLEVREQLRSLSSNPDIKLTWSPVCIKKCPNELDSAIECKPTSTTTEEDCAKEQSPFDPTLVGHVGYGTKDIFKKYCVPNLNKLPDQVDSDKFNNIINDFGLDDIQELYDDITLAKWIYLYSSISCVFVSVIYTVVIRFFAKPLVWLSIIGTILGLAALGMLLQNYHDNKYEVGVDDKVEKTIQIAVYVLYTVAGIFSLMILCLCKSIRISIAVLKTSAEVLMKNIRVLIMPFISCFFVIGFMGLWLVSMGYLLACGNIVTKDGSQLKTINFDGKEELKWQLGVSIFALFWISEFICAVFDFAIIVAVCTWYFTCNSDRGPQFTLLKGLYWAFRYNFGSLAIGSFLLAIIWTVRLIFEYVEKKLESLTGNNSAVACIKNVVRCCLDCCHRFIKFLNANAYIQVALTGESFCSSAMNAFVLALKNAASFTLTNGIGNLIAFLGKIFIACANTVVGYFMMTSIGSIKNDLESPIGPCLVVFILSYSMAAIFMSVYSMTSLTLLQCLYADVDICNQLGSDKYTNKQRPKEMQSVVNMLRK